MRFRLLTGLTVICFLAASAAAQSAPAPNEPVRHSPNRPGTTSALPASAANVGPNDAVITLSTTCKPEVSGCVSKVSREQFEKLANALQPNLTTDQRRSLAQDYGRLLVFADQARDLGIQNEPGFQALLQFAADQLLVKLLNQHYSEQYSHPTDQQIEDYYHQNNKKYVEANLQRIIIPAQPGSADAAKPTEQEQKAYIEQLRKRWMEGADPAALQAEAIKRMGLGSSPNVNMTNQRPNMLPSDQESIFNLKPGEISQPFSDPGAAFLYKMESVKQIPLSEVKIQIAKTIHDQAMHDKIQQLNDAAKPTLNEAYFGPDRPMGPTAGPEQGAAQSGSTPVASAPSPK